MAGKLTGKKPSGLLRFFLRAPIGIYKAKLGFVMGQRFLMLRHTGRKSGQPRFTVVEVVNHDAATDTWIICSGWGRKADWFRNIEKTPDVDVTVGTRTFPARADVLSEGDAVAALLAYAGKHPAAFGKLGNFMLGRTLEPTDADCRALAGEVPVVALRPRTTPASS